MVGQTPVLNEQNQGFAWEMAQAQTPAQEYLRDNPRLPADQVDAVRHEIGRVVTATQAYELGEIGAEALKQAGYTTVPLAWLVGHEQYAAQDEQSLLEVWAAISDIKLLNGRPVASEMDLSNFSEAQAATGEVSYNKTMGSRAWSNIKTVVQYGETYLPGRLPRATKELFDAITFMGNGVCREAGIGNVEHVDLYSLYVTMPKLLSWFERGNNMPAVRGVATPGREMIRFVISFLNYTLQLDPALRTETYKR